MKNDIHLLIEETQNERDQLAHEMQACIKEGDFLEAAAFQKALYFTEKKLRLLKNLEHPNYDRINELKQRISWIDHLKNESQSPAWFAYIEKEVAAYRQELSALEHPSYKFQVDGDELIKCLEAVQTDKLKCFYIEFDKSDVKIKIERKEYGLQLHLASKYKEPLENFTSYHGISELKKIGFTVEELTAILWVDQFEPTKILSIVEILSRVVFDVLRLYGGKTGIIKY